jgi:hypothetical protein
LHITQPRAAVAEVIGPQQPVATLSAVDGAPEAVDHEWVSGD